MCNQVLRWKEVQGKNGPKRKSQDKGIKLRKWSKIHTSSHKCERMQKRWISRKLSKRSPMGIMLRVEFSKCPINVNYKLCPNWIIFFVIEKVQKHTYQKWAHIFLLKL
jgi:hypothetical protein